MFVVIVILFHIVCVAIDVLIVNTIVTFCY